jgi:uncharacterized repeat protein (TIGR01451 family)
MPTNAIELTLHVRKRIAQAAIVLAMFFVASASWAAESVCPTSPNYTPNFASNQPCTMTNSDAAFVLGDLQLTNSLGNQTGSAWYLTPQTINNGFTTTFQFQFTNPSNPPADGIAFIIQNSGTSAIGYTGGNGGALAYGDDDSNTNPSLGEGIPSSIAIEFDSFQNAWDPAPVNNIDSHVAIQSCGAGPNTSHHNYLCQGTTGPNSTIGAPVSTENSGINIADGNVHNVTINYTPTCSTCTPATVANIQVYLDGVDLYPNGVPVDLSSILSTAGTAYVGFTGATGGEFETQDILSWTFAPTQEGQPINPSNPSSLAQSFVFSTTPGQYSEFDFNYTVPSTNGTLTIQPGTTPFVNNTGISQSDWATIVNGTSMADAPCLIAAGQTVCTVYTLTCTTTANSTPAGANCPQSSVRDVLFEQELDLLQNQTGIVNGILTVPPGYAPGLAMAPDVLVTGAECTYPAGGPLASQVCPQSIMTELEDQTPHGGGTGTTTNSSYVFFCCEPEWTTTPSIPVWNNSTSVAAAFTSAPPPTPNPNSNNFHAAQGESVIVGAEPHGTVLDTTYPLPGEQTLNNAVPCPAPGSPPATPWSTQNPQLFSVNGVITTYDNNGTASPLVEGAYDAHYFSVDCDAFEELVFPTSLNVQPGTPGANVALFKTVPFNIDLTKPTVTSITLNPPGGYYAPNTTLTATVSCTDPTSSNVFSGIATCGAQGSPQAFSGQQTVTTTPITLNTSTTGTQTFTAVASDEAGNVSPTSSVTYQVVGSAGLDIAMIGDLLVPTGSNMTYYIAVANTGPSTADEVTLTNPIPTGTTFVSAGFATESCAIILGLPICTITPPTTSCGSVAGTCNLGTLPVWSTKTPTGVLVQVTVNVNAKVNATISDTATVSEVNSNSNSSHSTVKWQTVVIK